MMCNYNDGFELCDTFLSKIKCGTVTTLLSHIQPFQFFSDFPKLNCGGKCHPTFLIDGVKTGWFESKKPYIPAYKHRLHCTPNSVAIWNQCCKGLFTLSATCTVIASVTKWVPLISVVLFTLNGGIHQRKQLQTQTQTFCASM